MPTGPGWWWVKADPRNTQDRSDREPFLVRRRGDYGLWVGATRLEDAAVEWIAPIPAPEVCMAVAQWQAAEVDPPEQEDRAVRDASLLIELRRAAHMAAP